MRRSRRTLPGEYRGHRVYKCRSKRALLGIHFFSVHTPLYNAGRPARSLKGFAVVPQ